MVEIRRIDAQGSPKEGEDAYKVFSVKIWTDDVKYHFSFEGGFYHCKRTGRAQKFTPDNMEMVETGTESGLEDFGVQEVADFCVDQVKQIEEEDRSLETHS